MEITTQEFAPGWDWSTTGPSDHVVQFYETDEFLVGSMHAFISAGLRSGDAAIVVVTPPHRAALDRRLEAGGIDIPGLAASGRYVSLDAAEVLGTLMQDGWPQEHLFEKVVGRLVRDASGGRRHVRVVGEMVAVLLARGQQAAVLRLEELWNLLHSHRDFSLLCAYPIAGFVGTGRAEGLDDICTQHAHVIPAESYSALTTPDERLSAIASLQQKAASLEAEVAEREAAVHHRDEFLSAISHDLKTPLTVLQGQAQLLRRRAARGSLDGPGLERGLEQIESRARLMAELIDELLDVTRLRSGQQLQLDRHLVELVGLVGEVIAVHQQTAPRHRLTLLTTEKSLPGRWDRRQLRRVLDNLLTNAVKYTPDGGEITLELARETAPTGDVVILTVTDPGIGIPGEDLPHIFERFYRGRNTASVNVGTGLGLAGARQIVEQHGGTIAAGSIPGQGATFTVRLPMQHSAG